MAIRTDDEILQMYLNPSTKEAGFKILMDQYQDKVYWQIRRMLKEHNDASDVMQNVFIKVWTALSSFKRESQLSTWLYRIAYNESLTFIGQRNRMALNDWENSENKVAGIRDSSYTSIKNDLYAHLDEAIETLPEKQKLVFKMRYYDEMPYEEMATVTGTSVGALKASYHHAVKKIEEYVKSALNENES
ncbi:MAG: RNA polymerase sigma factor [Chitinophagales bacterium]|nr:RNA polymerase sigma factor [Chitinophagales bacterium]